MMSTRKRTILVVEDNEDIINLYNHFLKDQLVFDNIVFARDGQDAIYKLQNQEFVLIILDMNLPKVKGDEILSFMKSQRISSKKVLISSAALDELRLKNAVNYGYKNVLVKPFNKKILFQKIKEVMF